MTSSRTGEPQYRPDLEGLRGVALGRISYLWHWPILVLGPVALGLSVAADEGADEDLATAVTCATDPCPPVIGSMLVYRDPHHLTATFVRSLVDELGGALPVVGDGSGRGHAGPGRRQVGEIGSD